MSFESVLTASNWGVEGSIPLLSVIFIAWIGTSVLFAISIVAYLRRGSRLYLLICVAVGALWGRSIVGMGTVLGVVPMVAHHLVEHSLDFLIAVVILYAVYVHAPGSFGDEEADLGDGSE